jgi:hypothetical protein
MIKITNCTYPDNGATALIEAVVDSATMTDPSGLPSDWSGGSMIYTADFLKVKIKDLDGTWVEVG